MESLRVARDAKALSLGVSHNVSSLSIRLLGCRSEDEACAVGRN
jgi:hypothetical protein